MDTIFSNVAKLLAPSVRLIEYTELTQNEIGKSGIVLWDKRPLDIERNVYLEFRESVKKRQHHKFYMFNHILPYSDFCISLLCSVQYSLNHTVTVSIPDKTYSAAWRTIGTISATGSQSVRTWINKYTDERTAIGYCISLGVVLDNTTVFMPYGDGMTNVNNIKDVELISNIGIRDKAVKIPVYHDDGNDNANDKCYDERGTIFDSTCTPEGQLDDLFNAHVKYTRKF